MTETNKLTGTAAPYSLAETCLELIAKLLLLIPNALRTKLFSTIAFGYFALSPKYRKIAEINLKIAFPESTPEWRRKIYHASVSNLGLVINDFLRLPKLTTAWVHAHVECSSIRTLHELRTRNPGRGIICVAGHLGSFELHGLVLGLLGEPMTVIGRSLKPEWFNRWWNKRRELSGNKIIDREGAFKKTLKVLNSGGQIAILFDQNVTRNHAIFVPWFGKPAATTKALALLALRSKASIIVTSMHTKAENSYHFDLRPIDLSDLTASDDFSDKNIALVTDRIVKAYEERIKKDPASWFWIHRRWKTSPDPEIPEDLYN